MNNEIIDTEEVIRTNGKQSYKLPVFQQLAILGVLLFVIFATSLSPRIFAFITAEDTPSDAIRVEESLQASVQHSDTGVPFENITLTARSAYVWDNNTQKALFKKEESTQLPLASITKLMTALVAHEILDESDTIRIDELSIKQDGFSGLQEGEVFDRLTLTDLVLMSSSNDGAFALAAAAGNALLPNSGASSFVTAMNVRAEEIGLLETYFKNPTGLDLSETEGGAYGSARDVAFLMEYILRNEPDILTYTREEEASVYSTNGVEHDAENTNYFVDQIPGLIGSKTGYTDLAGGNLVIAFNAGLDRPIVVVVLGSTQHDRFTDTLKLVEEAQKYVAQTAQQ